MKRFDQINVIPFIDIMLVLLAIVLTTATFIAQGHIPVQLPAAKQNQNAENLQRLEIEIDREGLIYQEGEAIHLVHLEALLEKQDKDFPVWLRVDARTDFQSFVRVADAIRRHGMNRVSILTIKAQ
jgi:biopolymer transport protein ExbD